MKKIFKEGDYNLYMLWDFVDIEQMNILVTRENNPDTEYLVVNGHISYRNDINIYNYNTFDAFSIREHNDVVKFIIDGVTKYLHSNEGESNG